MNSPVDLTNCDREPIHIPGAIQPHGALLACELPSLLVLQASENTPAYFGERAEALLGRALTTLFDAAATSALRDLPQQQDLRALNPLRLRTSTGLAVDAVMHRSGDALVVELEPANQALESHLGRSFDPRLRGALLRLQGALDVNALCELAAHEVRELTGFDRVMIYRFDESWNGEVVAESKAAHLEPFLGQHYPASDIPAQARRLYTVNWLRFIADVNDVPQALVPALDPNTHAPLDLSFSILRAVSPIHITYLKNMGVRASMSISLVIEGKLSGLIACHHYASAHVVPFTVRDSAEYLGQALSWQLHLLESADLAQKRRVAQAHEAALMRSVASAGELLTGLSTDALLGLVEADGAAVVLVEGTRSVGDAPAGEVLHAIVEALAQEGSDVFATDNLESLVPGAAAWHDQAAGVLAVAISRDLHEYIVWFRRAVDRTIRWAGDPRKLASWGTDPRAPRLTPRGSFEVWLEEVRGRSAPWAPWQVEFAGNIRRALLGGVRKRAVELQSANRRLIDSDRIKDEFIATVSHELRTPLNAIIGWTDIAQMAGEAQDRVEHALKVISRNARQQARLVDDLLDVSRIATGKLALQVEPVDFSAIVEHATEGALVAAEAKSIRLTSTIDSSGGVVLGDAARLHQVITNLLTNAIKFTPKGGHVKVTVRRLRSDLELEVRDTGQGIDASFLPHVFELFRQEDQGASRRAQGLGLGLALVKRLIELHGGRVRAHSEGAGRGACFCVTLPVAPVRQDEGERTQRIAHTGFDLKGVHVLVVEDDDDARELLSAVLGDTGAQVTPVADAHEALALLDANDYSVIVSDVGLPEMDGLQFMRTLRRRSSAVGRATPAVAMTAYTRAVDRTAALQAGFQAHVPKPIDREELLTVVASLVAKL